MGERCLKQCTCTRKHIHTHMQSVQATSAGTHTNILRTHFDSNIILQWIIMRVILWKKYECKDYFILFTLSFSLKRSRTHTHTHLHFCESTELSWPEAFIHLNIKQDESRECQEQVTLVYFYLWQPGRIKSTPCIYQPHTNSKANKHPWYIINELKAESLDLTCWFRERRSPCLEL